MEIVYIIPQGTDFNQGLFVDFFDWCFTLPALWWGEPHDHPQVAEGPSYTRPWTILRVVHHNTSVDL